MPGRSESNPGSSGRGMAAHVREAVFRRPATAAQPAGGARPQAAHVQAAVTRTGQPAPLRGVLQGSFPHGLPSLLSAPALTVQPRTPPQRPGDGRTFPVPPHLAPHFRAAGGQPLPEPVRQRMESHFGASFADVRVHMGHQAALLGARAVTQGSTLYFAPGQYQPGTPQGDRLLAHELTHVLQQRAGRVRNPPGPGLAVVHDQALEAEADRMSLQVARHRKPRTDHGPARPRTPGLSPHGTTAQPMMHSLAKAYYSVRGNTVPPGVVQWEDLGAGYGVGYHSGKRWVVLYGPKGPIAHIEIQPSNEDLILHTRTDSGEEGGQGYIVAMFPVALKIIYKYFSAYKMIHMTPALGAATKGLISQVSRARLRVGVLPHTKKTLLGPARMDLAGRFIKVADQRREQREKEKKRSGKKKIHAQSWQPEIMVETAHELNALREMESVSPTGLEITGVTGAFAEQLVGPRTPLLEAGAFAWHKSATQTGQGTLLITIPVNSIPYYLSAL